MLAVQELQERLRAIKMLILDVDGVMTDGGIIVGEDGVEIKRFNVHDGSAVVFLRRGGIETVIISGRECEAVRLRAKELEIGVVQGYPWKQEAWDELFRCGTFKAEEICCVGDDLHDLPLFRRAGLAVAVANARREAKAAAHYVTEADGGHGAVREVAELILKAQGKWDAIVARYLV